MNQSAESSTSRRQNFDLLLLLMALIGVIVAWVAWAADSSRGWVAFAALGLVFIVGALRRPLRFTGVELPLLLWLATAAWSVTLAPEQDGSRAIFTNPIGWEKFWGLLLAVAFFYALSLCSREREQPWVLGLLSAWGTAIALLFIGLEDWNAGPARFAFITRLGFQLQRLLSLPPFRATPNANVTASAVAPLLPVALGLLWWGIRTRRWLALLWGAATAIVMGLTLLLTFSRGAWLAVGAAMALAALAWLTRNRWQWFFGGVLLVGLLSGGALLAMPSLRAMLFETASESNRLALLAQGWLLVRDYPFTGFGLGNYPMVHSAYALLLHVAVLPHGHALLLDLWMEQGLLGLLAFGGLWIAVAVVGLRAFFRREGTPLLPIGLLTLVVVSLHGLVDDPLYGTRTVVLLLLPPGLILAGLSTGKRPSWVWQACFAGALVLGAAIVSLLPAGRALWYANLGAVTQTQVELRLYDSRRFNELTLDQVRQQSDLTVAEAYYQQALILDAQQVTARTRLAQIALSRNDYDAALLHAGSAWNAGYRDRVTRLLYGDALVAHGRVAEAIEIVRGLPWAKDRLLGQAWARYHLGGDKAREAYAREAARVLER